MTVAIPLVGHLVVGMAAPEYVLIKQKPEVAPGAGFNGPHQIQGFYGAVGVLIYKAVDGLPEQVIPQLAAEHVVDAGPFFIDVTVVEFNRLPIHMGDHGATIAALVFR
jgi:hypothetical protein